jgi:hypothetical protein
MSFHPVIILKRENLPLASGSACLLLIVPGVGLSNRSCNESRAYRESTGPPAPCAEVFANLWTGAERPAGVGERRNMGRREPDDARPNQPNAIGEPTAQLATETRRQADHVAELDTLLG